MTLTFRRLLSAGVAAAALAAPWTAGAAPVLSGTAPQVNAGGALPTIIPGTTTTVDLNAPRTIIDWSSFNVASGEQVIFGFDQRGWIALNRVASGVINIDGVIKGVPGTSFTAPGTTGNVWFYSPTGVVFGANARVDVGGLLATTSLPDVTDFLTPSNGTFNFTGSGSGGPVRVRAGARITGTTQTLAFVAPQVITDAGAVINGTSQVLYGAADSYRIRFGGAPDNDLDIVDFIVPAASMGTPIATALNLAGSTDGENVYLFAISRASAASLLINAPGLITAGSSSFFAGAVLISTGQNLVDGAVAFGTTPFATPGVTTGSASIGTVRAQGRLVVNLNSDTELGDFSAVDVKTGAQTYLAARNITIGPGGLDAGSAPDPAFPTNNNVTFDSYGIVSAPLVKSVGPVSGGRFTLATPRSALFPDFRLGSVLSQQSVTLNGRAISIGSADAVGAVALALGSGATGPVTAGSLRGSSVFVFSPTVVTVDSITATGAVAGTNPFSTSVSSGDLQVSSNIRAVVGSATAVGNAGISAGSTGVTTSSVDVGSVSASSVGLISISVTARDIVATGVANRPNTIVIAATGPNAVPLNGVSAIASGPISVGTIASAGRVRVTTNGDIDVGTVTAPGADIGAAGNLRAGTISVSGDYLFGALGKSSVDILDGGGNSTIGLGTGFTIGTRVTAPNLILIRGQVVGGSGAGGLSNADFQKLRVPGRVDIYGGELPDTFAPADPGGDVGIRDLDVDPARIGSLALFAAPGRSINITGALRYNPTTTLLFGDARPEWQADRVVLTGSVTAPNLAFTVDEIEGFGRLSSTGSLAFLNPHSEAQFSTLTANVVTAPNDLNLTLDNLDLSGSLTVGRNLVLAAHRGDVILGGTSGDLITNAEFGRIRAAEVDIFAGADIDPLTQPRGNMTVLDLDVDPAKVPRLGLYGQGDHSITIAGALRPTTSGGVLQIGALAVRDSDVGDLRTARIIITGSIGSASGSPERGYTDVRAFRSVELNALDNVLFGSASFAELVGRTPPDQIDIGHGKPAGAEPAASDVGHIWLAAGSLTASAKQRIVSQNTGQGGLQNGLYITGDGVAATDPVLRANGAAVVDLYGAFQGERGLVSGFSATFSSRLSAEGSTTVRFNGCAVGAGCQITTPAAEFRIEQVDSVVASSSTATGAAVVVDPPLFTPPPQVADDDRQEDVVVTGAGNEEIWRRKP